MKSYERWRQEFLAGICPPWWPWPYLCINRMPFWALLIGILLGSILSWWLNYDKPRWMHFESLSASYVLGEKEIELSGAYVVARPCHDGKGPIIWRAEALATDGQVAIYGPSPALPDLDVGYHQYADSIQLLQTIQPDGWVVRIIVTCPGEQPETVVSPPARVMVLDRRLRDKGPR